MATHLYIQAENPDIPMGLNLTKLTGNYENNTKNIINILKKIGIEKKAMKKLLEDSFIQSILNENEKKGIYQAYHNITLNKSNSINHEWEEISLWIGVINPD